MEKNKINQEDLIQDLKNRANEGKYEISSTGFGLESVPNETDIEDKTTNQ
ncbi:hypothetical protein [Bacillus sp. Marseille-P3661]|nr:hypothetical protein [Bacillus sp. Marseille-P3661]